MKIPAVVPPKPEPSPGKGVGGRHGPGRWAAEAPEGTGGVARGGAFGPARLVREDPGGRGRLEALGAGGQSRPRWIAQACKCGGESPPHLGKVARAGRHRNAEAPPEYPELWKVVGGRAKRGLAE